jgi:hypothetical protein
VTNEGGTIEAIKQLVVAGDVRISEHGYDELSDDDLEDNTGWSPYLTVEDACRLDDVRDALRRGDISTASRLARVFRLEPVVSN